MQLFGQKIELLHTLLKKIQLFHCAFLQVFKRMYLLHCREAGFYEALMQSCVSFSQYSICIKLRKRAKIRNQYNQAPHLTQDTNGKMTTSQLDMANESQEVSPFPAGDHKASINRRAQKLLLKHAYTVA